MFILHNGNNNKYFIGKADDNSFHPQIILANKTATYWQIFIYNTNFLHITFLDPDGMDNSMGFI